MTFTMKLYKVKGTWYFDDASRDIKKEAFVLGATAIINKYLGYLGMGHRKRNVNIVFSTEEIDQHHILLTMTEACTPYSLDKLKETFGEDYESHIYNSYAYEGVVDIDTEIPDNVVEDWRKLEGCLDHDVEPTSAYYKDEENEECWLCPAQLKFFGSVAPQIYVKIIK